MTTSPNQPVPGRVSLTFCFDPCIQLTLDTLETAEAPETQTLRAQMEESLNTAVLAAEAGFDKPTAFRARRLVTAWADERLSTDEWPGREEWQSHPLQSDWEEGRTGGEWFFDGLDDLTPDKNGHHALAALALRLLSLGMDGKLYSSGAELLRLRRSLAQRFGIQHPPAPFPPPLHDGEPKKPGRSGSLIPLLLPLLAAALLVLAMRSANTILESIQ